LARHKGSLKLNGLTSENNKRFETLRQQYLVPNT
jgi:uncharacterized protein YnzC (UPF0291/DUF896 family)